LDLVVCNYLDWTVESNRAHDFRLDGGERAYGPPTAFGGTFSFLYHNEGGRFVDVTEEAGLQVRNRDTQVPVGKSLGVVPVDVNRDGWMDIVVANDTVRNFFFQNQRDGTFKEAGTFVGIAYGEQGRERGAMGIDAAFFRNNSALGVVIGNFYNEMTGLFVDRDGQMLFSDEAVPTGLGPPTRLELTFGVFFFDYDLDGRLDIFAANGHLEEDIGKVQESQHYEQSPQLFWNTGGEAAYEYVKVSSANSGEAFFKPLVGRAAVFGDLDNDGDLDVIITSCGQRPRILRNDQQLSHHWLRFRLTGTRCNRDAIGAVVEVRAGDETFRRRLMPTRSYLSQTERVVTIGLGKREDVDQVTIHWPDGSRQEVEVLIDSMNEIIQSKE
jgi:hypothetical protein